MDNSNIKKTVVVYSGRFQPFHKGHYATYQKLASKFGADNVYIATSDKTDNQKSPFNFNEKREIMTKMFGISPNKIVQVKNPYAPKEVLDKFNPETTAYISAVGEKDSTRLGGKYFEPYKGVVSNGYDVVGYVYPVPSEPNTISGTDVRKWLSTDEEEAKKMFSKIYPKWDSNIFKLITSKLKLMEGLVYPGHRGMFGEDDLEPNDIDELVLAADSFIESYFNEDAPSPNRNNPVMDKQITYTAKDGLQKKITVGGALRLPKQHPAHIQASKMVAQSPKPIQPVRNQDTPPVPGLPLQRKQTPQGKIDAQKAKFFKPTYIYPTPENPQPTTKQSLKGKDFEDINIDVDKGDTVLMGKFKNHPVTVKDISTDDHGMPTINGKKATTFRTTDEMSQSQLKNVDRYADSQLNPVDVQFTKHFFDRVNDPRNGREITEPELTAFFTKISKDKKHFIDFLERYKEIVVKDKDTNINIPFVKMANKAIAKTVMRKGNFMTSNPTLVNESVDSVSVKPLAEFIKYAKKRLELKQFPKIKLITDGEFPKQLRAFGGYDPETDEIHLYVKGRNVVDVIRTLAHELVHLKQKEDGRVTGVEDGATGSDIENEANAAAGILLRDFGKVNPAIYESKYHTKLLVEGGAYGHMNHPFDVGMNLTFGDLKKIISNALDGTLGVVREKTDGQALAISWRNGKLIAARNKGHLANSGANALDSSALASKFAGRGALSDAYNFAMKDLSAAISALSESERQSIFKGGSAFCNLEVIYPENANVIPYGQSLLIFHNVVQYDEKGNAIGEVKGAESKLAAMVKQVNADVQSKYTIQGPPITKLPKDEKLSSQKGKFNSMLSKLQSEFGLSDKDGVADYHYAWWMKFVNNSKKNFTKEEKEGLANRWAFDDKKFSIKSIADEDARKWADGVDKDAKDKITKGNLRKFEDIFLGVGAEVLSFMSSVLTAQPDSALQSIKSSLESAISQIQSTGTGDQIKKLEKELARLNAIGGFDKLVPNEGLVFFYKGNTYKLTGTFAPLNQILGIFKFSR